MESFRLTIFTFISFAGGLLLAFPRPGDSLRENGFLRLIAVSQLFFSFYSVELLLSALLIFLPSY